MARLRRNKQTRRLYIRIWRGDGCSTHTLNSPGEERLKKYDVNEGACVPSYVLQLLDENSEVFPPTGAFKGQLQFMPADYLKLTRRLQTKAEKQPAELRIITSDWKQLTFEWRTALKRAA